MDHRYRAVSVPRIRSRAELNRQRWPRAHSCWDHLLAAPLWPLHGANLGTLLRTCDAVGACLVVPRLPWVPEALARGNTLRRRSCVHWVRGAPVDWLAGQQARGSAVVGVELVDEAVRLADLPAARGRTVMVLGHEQTGIPPTAWSCSTTRSRSPCSAPVPASTLRSPDRSRSTEWPACSDPARPVAG